MELSVSVQQFLQLALIGIIAVAVPVITVQVIKWLKSKAAELGTQMNANQLYLLQQFAAIAAKAMEQAQLKENLEATAEQMLAGAVDIVQGYLDAAGITSFSVAEIVAAIRAGLKDGVHKAEEPETPAQ